MENDKARECYKEIREGEITSVVMEEEMPCLNGDRERGYNQGACGREKTRVLGKSEITNVQ